MRITAICLISVFLSRKHTKNKRAFRTCMVYNKILRMTSAVRRILIFNAPVISLPSSAPVSAMRSKYRSAVFRALSTASSSLLPTAALLRLRSSITHFVFFGFHIVRIAVQPEQPPVYNKYDGRLKSLINGRYAADITLRHMRRTPRRRV